MPALGEYTRRIVRSISLATFMGVLAVACSLDWFLYARNASDDTVLLRVVYTQSDVAVFRLPPGFDGYLGGRGGEEDAWIELLDETCRVIDSTETPDIGAVQVTIDGLLNVTAEQTDFRANDDVPRPEELRGECGSTKSPSSEPG